MKGTQAVADTEASKEKNRKQDESISGESDGREPRINWDPAVPVETPHVSMSQRRQRCEAVVT